MALLIGEGSGLFRFSPVFPSLGRVAADQKPTSTRILRHGWTAPPSSAVVLHAKIIAWSFVCLDAAKLPAWCEKLPLGWVKLPCRCILWSLASAVSTTKSVASVSCQPLMTPRIEPHGTLHLHRSCQEWAQTANFRGRPVQSIGGGVAKNGGSRVSGFNTLVYHLVTRRQSRPVVNYSSEETPLDWIKLDILSS